MLLHIDVDFFPPLNIMVLIFIQLDTLRFNYLNSCGMLTSRYIIRMFLILLILGSLFSLIVKYKLSSSVTAGGPALLSQFIWVFPIMLSPSGLSISQELMSFSDFCKRYLLMYSRKRKNMLKWTKLDPVFFFFHLFDRLLQNCSHFFFSQFSWDEESVTRIKNNPVPRIP